MAIEIISSGLSISAKVAPLWPCCPPGLRFGDLLLPLPWSFLPVLAPKSVEGSAIKAESMGERGN